MPIFDEAARDTYIVIQSKITDLEKYYVSPVWKEDFEASESGKLPEDLLCGVLSEDGIDHLLEDNRQLQDEIKAIAKQLKK